MRLDDRDRGRILLATVITLIALPTIWLLNRDEDGPGAARPNVAAAGLNPGEADASATPDAGTPEQPSFNPMGTGGAAYLETQPTSAPEVSPVIAVGSTPGEFVANTEATYSNDDVYGGTCLYNGLPGGERITVINVANSRSITCTSAYFGGGNAEGLIMHASQFREIAELISAPIHVEVRT